MDGFISVERFPEPARSVRRDESLRIDLIENERVVEPATAENRAPARPAVRGLSNRSIENVIDRVRIDLIELDDAAVAVVDVDPGRAAGELLGSVVLAGAVGGVEIEWMRGDALVRRDRERAVEIVPSLSRAVPVSCTWLCGSVTC